MPDRAICEVGVCWCKTPFTGSKCQSEVDIKPRIGRVLSAGILVCVAFVAFICGVFVFNSCSGNVSASKRYAGLPRKTEQWQV